MLALSILQSAGPPVADFVLQSVHAPATAFHPLIPQSITTSGWSVYLSGLPWWLKDAEIVNLVREMSGISSFSMVFDILKENGKARGVFINVHGEQFAALVAQSLNGKCIHNRRIKTEVFAPVISPPLPPTAR